MRYTKTNDPEVSKDLVQTTFLKTLLYLQKGGKVDLMRSFLYHVLNALIIDEYRKNKMMSLDVILEKGFEFGNDDHDRNIDILDGKEIILLIPQLPKKYEQIIRMRYIKKPLPERNLPDNRSVREYRGCSGSSGVNKIKKAVFRHTDTDRDVFIKN